MTEAASGNPATQANAAAWAERFGMTGIVVADSSWDNGPNWYPFGVDIGGGQYNIGLPGIILVDNGMAVATMSEPSPNQIQATLN